ncbi:hypothetical protein BGW80DRAFT_305364 [Lactifluus volemus]|nr:hypothetical protein BGW80DRAFT_305364 [Lactifluus volemus]
MLRQRSWTTGMTPSCALCPVSNAVMCLCFVNDERVFCSSVFVLNSTMSFSPLVSCLRLLPTPRVTFHLSTYVPFLSVLHPDSGPPFVRLRCHSSYVPFFVVCLPYF